LHLGVSYMINDIYQPYLAPGRTQQHYVKASQLTMLLGIAIAAYLCLQLTGITEVYRFLGVYGAGLGTVMIMRWFWWRVNAKAEIAALLASGTLAVVQNTHWAEGLLAALCTKLGLITGQTINPDFFAVRVMISTLLVSGLWITVALLTNKKEPSEKIIEFYRKVRLVSPGWNYVAKKAGIRTEQASIGQELFAWGISVVWLYSALVAIGKLLFHQWAVGAACSAIALSTGILLYKKISKHGLL